MSHYSIKDLEQLSGIKAHTLRIWEQRYNLLAPKRTETNIRFYDEHDLKLILNVALLNDNGLKISKIASMDRAQIHREVLALTEKSLTFEDQIQALTISMIELDEARFEKLLSKSIQRLGFEQTMLQIIYPFMSKIGILWQTGTINPAQEHFISNLVRQKLISAIDQLGLNGNGKKFLLFLPEDELHEISLLFAAYLIKARGHKVIYLGQSTPFNDLRSVANFHQPDYLISVFTTHPVSNEVQGYLNSLVSIFPETKILISGYQVIGQHLTLPKNVQKLDYIREIREIIEELESVITEK